MDSITYEQGGFYIFDRGYTDFARVFSSNKKSFL
jgi:hypothetical protein